MKVSTAIVLALSALPLAAPAQQTITVGPYMATLNAGTRPTAASRSATFDLFVMDSVSMAASERLALTARFSMPSMAGMVLDAPVISPGDKPGHYAIKLTFPHDGVYRLDVSVPSKSGKSVVLSFDVKPGTSSEAPMAMEGMSMRAALGSWPANREGSGTSWLPDSSPMFMKMLPSVGGFELSTMGTIQSGYVDAGRPRGAKGFFSDSMVMLMGQKQVGGGTVGFNFMGSLDPVINGQFGVPDLFQTGETAHGVPLVDRQHPHNLFSEIAATYSHRLTNQVEGFVYGGPVGEPALGGVMYLHRPSGMEVPEAPISHHWFDSTHISFGVLTAGLVFGGSIKVEGSVFNGHEPGENRYEIGPEALNSASGRVSYNPNRDWSFAASYGYISSPEALSPGVNEHRATLSAAYSHDLRSGDTIAASAYFGRNIVEGVSTASNAWLAEATYYHRDESIFARFERVDKDELANVPAGNYTVNKLVFGDVHTISRWQELDFGLGAYAGVYSFPSVLNALYGRNPMTFGVFLRVRPGRM